MNDLLHHLPESADFLADFDARASGPPVWIDAPRPEQTAQFSETSDVSTDFQTVRIWGLPLARLTHERTVDVVEALIRRGKPAFFITANLHYAMLSHRDPRLRRVNCRAALITADGMPMIWYSWILRRPLPQRVTGADLLYSLCGRAADRGYRVFFLGGAAGVADEAAERLSTVFPGLQIAGTAAPELDRLTPMEHQRLVDRIRSARADLLFVAFGQPKGELWLAEHLEALGVPVSAQIGASLDFVVGRVPRAPAWMQRIGLEWLYRTWREPKRLLPRYAANARFLMLQIGRDALAAMLKRRIRRAPDALQVP